MSPALYCGCPKCDTVFKLPINLPDGKREQSAEFARCGTCKAVFDVNINLMQKTDDGFVAIGLRHQTGNKADSHSYFDDSVYNYDTLNQFDDFSYGGSLQRGQSAEKKIKGTLIREEVNPFDDRVPISIGGNNRLDIIDSEESTRWLRPQLAEEPILSEDPNTALNNITVHKAKHYIADRPNPLKMVGWGIAIIGFVWLLGVQAKYFFVEQYAQDATYRQYLMSFCKIADCRLAPRQDPFRFTLTSTQIEHHPSKRGAMRVTVTAVNRAEFAQPYPYLQLTLSDRVGRVVGRRTFSPNLYLPKGKDNMVAQGKQAIVVLNFARLHKEAVGFLVDIVSAPASL